MPTRHRSSALRPGDAELRLPRAPGLLRRFWARHARLADALLCALCFLIAALPLVAYLPPVISGADDLAVPGASEQRLGLSLVVMTVAAFSCLALLRRRQYPVTVFAVAVSVTLASDWTLQGGGFTILFAQVALYGVAVYRSSRAAWISFGAASFVAVLSSTAHAVLLGRPVDSGAGGGAGGWIWQVMVVAMLIAALIGVNVGNRRRYLTALIDRSRQLLVERDQQAQLAAATERTRIAREMHDIVSHNLTVIVALADGAAATGDPARARSVSEQVAATARGALSEMRSMLGVLRDPGASADAPLMPIDDRSIQAMVSAAQSAGFPVTLRTLGSIQSASQPVRLAVARIVQESLTNAMRHAPEATRIEVTLAAHEECIDITVENDGAPSPPREPSSPGGFGLRGIEERVAHVGGSLTAGPVAQEHWRVHARIPLSAERIQGAAT